MFMFIKENLANIAALLIMLTYLLIIANIEIFQDLVQAIDTTIFQ
ncbi:MAG: hypothetical protein ABSC45_01130 [Desulfobaccales bacterium]